jgi:hypothetical protein
MITSCSDSSQPSVSCFWASPVPEVFKSGSMPSTVPESSTPIRSVPWLDVLGWLVALCVGLWSGRDGEGGEGCFRRRQAFAGFGVAGL